MKKRGQSAMEFLMTYGWAILVVLIILSSLYFLGIFSPKIPSTCNIQPPFICNDFKVLEDGVIFVISSGKISSGSIDSITVNGQDCYIIDSTLENNQVKNIRCNAVDLSDANKVTANIEITYTKETGLSHTIIGEGSGAKEEGIVGYIPLNGLIFGWAGNDSNDYIGGLSGTLGGELIPGNSYSIAPDNIATNFDGVNDVLSFSDNPALRMTTGGTISFWANLRSRGADGYSGGSLGGHIINKGGSVYGTNGYTLFTLSSTELIFRVNEDWVNFAIPNSFGDWTHYVITFDNTTGRALYVNGVLTSSSGFTQVPPNVAGGFSIGNVAGGGRPVNGIIDEVAVWNRVLSAGEVSSLYYYYI